MPIDHSQHDAISMGVELPGHRPAARASSPDPPNYTRPQVLLAFLMFTLPIAHLHVKS